MTDEEVRKAQQFFGLQTSSSEVAQEVTSSRPVIATQSPKEKPEKPVKVLRILDPSWPGRDFNGPPVPPGFSVARNGT